MNAWLELETPLAVREWVNIEHVYEISLGKDGKYRAWVKLGGDQQDSAWVLTEASVRKLGLLDED